MIDPDAKDRLVEQFRACLDSSEDEGPGDGESIDLLTLLAEMAALKNEVRLQARQFKSALEQMQALSDVLREQNETLMRELERSRSLAADTKLQAERGLLLGLLELRDRLQAGLDAQTAWRPSPLARVLRGVQRYLRSLREGSALTLQRLDELLGSHRVRPIAALGRALDPQCMQAVATERHPETADGVVLCELRRGFLHGTELLRAAEVIVNKKGPAT